MNLTTLFDTAIERKASDIHLATGEIPCLRISGDLVRVDMPALDREGFALLLEPALSPESRARVAAGQPVDCTIAHREFHFVLFVFPCGDGDFAATFRLLATGVPSMDRIGIGGMKLFDALIEARRGLVFIVGPTGSGKWTAACALVEAINERKPSRIFVIEDRTSYQFESKKGLVTQLPVGSHYEGYERALETINHADLDVVAVDAVPTAESLRKILVLAETGHLVIVNLHADSVPDALQRLIVSAGSDADALRRSLAQNIVAISVQRLAPRCDEPGRVAAYEWVTATPAVREALLCLLPARLAELQSTDPECRSLDQALEDLVQTGYITEETAAAVRLGAP